MRWEKKTSGRRRADRRDLPDTGAEGAAHVAEAVHDALAGLAVEAGGVDVEPIAVSIGLAFGLHRMGGSPAELLGLADTVLYEAKAAGRNRTCYAVMDVTSGRRPLTSPRLAMAASGGKSRRSA